MHMQRVSDMLEASGNKHCLVLAYDSVTSASVPNLRWESSRYNNDELYKEPGIDITVEKQVNTKTDKYFVTVYISSGIRTLNRSNLSFSNGSLIEHKNGWDIQHKDHGVGSIWRTRSAAKKAAERFHQWLFASTRSK